MSLRPVESQAPYPGLRSFRQNEVDIFFGRDDHIDEMIAKLAKTHFLCITGPSGCGKSSLARTGLMNGLASGFLPGTGSDWIFVDMRPGADPLASLFHAIAAAILDTSDGNGNESTRIEEVTRGGLQLRELSNLLANQVASRSRDLAAALDVVQGVAGRPILILVDQFEELFRYVQNDPRAAVTFVDVLLQTVAAAKNIYVAITIRTDSLEQCSRYPGLALAINSSQFLTPLLDRFQIQQAIEGPMAVFGGTVDSELTIRLLNSVENDADKLPLLQHALKLLYQRKAVQAGWLTSSDLHERPDDPIRQGELLSMRLRDFIELFPLDTNGSDPIAQGSTILQRLLSERLDAIYRDLPDHLQRGAERIFCALTAVESSKLDVREPISRAQLEQTTNLSRQEAQQVVLAFAEAGDSYLSVTKNQNDPGLDSIDVTHECILRRWDRLQREWLPRERMNADNIRYLAQSAKNYETSIRHRGWLSRIFPESTLSGKTLQLYRQWFEAMRPTAAWASRYLRDFVWYEGPSDSVKLSSDAIFEKIRHFLALCRRESRRDHVRRAVAVVVVGVLCIMVWYNGQTTIERFQLWADVNPFLLHKVLSSERERALIPGSSFKECTMCPEMVVVPAGQFVMGSPVGEPDRQSDEGPPHTVRIGEPFAVAQYDVTFDQWDVCYNLHGCKNRPGDSGWGRGRLPVIYVSWNDAQDYVKWLRRETGKPYRLLTEAEWEYAARAGTTTVYYWGDQDGTGRANCRGCGSKWGGVQTAPVGSFPRNNFQLYDMAGNVWQWVEDCYHENIGYLGAPNDGSAWTESGNCVLRVLRGGNWYATAKFARSAKRDNFYPNAQTNGLGFRVARRLGP